MLNIPVGRRASGILHALDRAQRENDPAILAQWYLDNPGVALDEGESAAVAAYLREHCKPRRPANRPRALSPQDAGWIIARVREFDRLFEPEDRAKKVLILTLAETFGVSVSTVGGLAKEARRMPDARKK